MAVRNCGLLHGAVNKAYLGRKDHRLIHQGRSSAASRQGHPRARQQCGGSQHARRAHVRVLTRRSSHTSGWVTPQGYDQQSERLVGLFPPRRTMSAFVSNAGLADFLEGHSRLVTERGGCETCELISSAVGGGMLAMALLLTGDSFRNSHWQLDFRSCGDGTMDLQRQAARSHVDILIKPLEAAAYAVYVIGMTYQCSNQRNYTAALRDMYRRGNSERPVTIAVVPRNNTLVFGGQLRALQGTLNIAMKLPAQLEYVTFMRWDVAMMSAPLTPVELRCLFGGQPVARNYAHFSGYTTEEANRKVNIDWVLVVPKSLTHQLQRMMHEDPESCCSTEVCGPACSFCADALNRRVSASLFNPVQACSNTDKRILKLQKLAPLSNTFAGVVANGAACQKVRAHHAQLLNQAEHIRTKQPSQMLQMREWLLQSAGVKATYVDRVLALLDGEEITDVEDNSRLLNLRREAAVSRQGATWILGERNLACTHVCERLDMRCSRSEMQSIRSIRKIRSVAQKVGRTCNNTANWGDNFSPSICTGPGCCHGNCIGVCGQGSRASSCRGADLSTQRLCACRNRNDTAPIRHIVLAHTSLWHKGSQQICPLPSRAVLTTFALFAIAQLYNWSLHMHPYQSSKGQHDLQHKWIHGSKIEEGWGSGFQHANLNVRNDPVALNARACATLGVFPPSHKAPPDPHDWLDITSLPPPGKRLARLCSSSPSDACYLTFDNTESAHNIFAHILSYGGPDRFFNTRFRERVRAAYMQANVHRLGLMEKAAYNIVVHVRRDDILKATRMTAFAATVSRICRAHPRAVVHAFSAGHRAKHAGWGTLMLEFVRAGCGSLTVHLDIDEFKTWTNMVAANALVLSRSLFSLVPALISGGEVHAPSNVNQKWYLPHWAVFNNTDGTLL